MNKRILIPSRGWRAALAAATKHDPFDRGLRDDLRVLEAQALGRRRLLELGVFATIGTALGCDAVADGSGLGTEADAGGASCSLIPPETAGPYPGDGTNGPDALGLSGIVRRDIRSSVAGASGIAQGVPLNVELTIVDARSGCAPLEGYAVYAWHCDRDGNYSMYSAPVANENYLRGVQVSDASGLVFFDTVFPGCYSGRWPHVHFEVYSSLTLASNGRSAAVTSQLAFPEDACDEAYATSGYEASVQNLGRISLASDNVFSDGVGLQLATMEGAVATGFVARLTVPV